MSVAWATSSMSSSHGTVTDCCTEELKTKGWKIARSGPTTWTTQHEQRAVDPSCVVKQKEQGSAHTESEKLQFKIWCVWTLRCGHCGVVRRNTDTKEGHAGKQRPCTSTVMKAVSQPKSQLRTRARSLDHV